MKQSRTQISVDDAEGDMRGTRLNAADAEGKVVS